MATLDDVVRKNKFGQRYCNSISANKKQFCRMLAMDGSPKCRRHSEEAWVPPERQCDAMSSFNQERCRRIATRGARVCAIHGGSSPLVRKRAKLLLLAEVEPTIARMVDIRDQDEDRRAAQNAAEFIYQRAIMDDEKREDAAKGLRPGTGTTVQIGFSGLGGIDMSKVAVGARVPKQIEGVKPVEGELIDPELDETITLPDDIDE